MPEKEEEGRFIDAMEKLRLHYREKLSAQLGEIQALATKLATSDAILPILDILHQELHKIAGGAGTFGMPELGRKARTLEIQIKGIRNRAAAGKSASVPDILTALKALEIPPETSDTFAPSGSESGGERPLPPLSPQILIIDADEKRVRELCLSLRYFGYQPRVSSSLAEAGNLSGEKKPDALLLAIRSGTDPDQGEGLRNQLRPIFPKTPPPLIFLADSTDFSTRLAVARAGGQGFFTHPLDVPKIVDRLEQLTRRDEALPYRVLIVDDDPLIAEHFRLVLQAAGMDAFSEKDPARVLEMLSSLRPELLLMDVHMEGCSGTELARIIRMEEEWVGIPILYLSAEKDLREQIRALNSGGDDFITKPVDSDYLVAAVSAHVSRARRITELMAKDSLTGLLKHIRIKEALDVEMSRSCRDGSPLCLVMLDLDHFKNVNDTWGHSTGDRVIKALAHLLTRRLRRSDSIGRYGGEEFMVVLPGCEGDTAWRLMEDIRKNFKTILFHAKGETFTVTCSIGIACTRLGVSAEELLNAADKALYQAKADGRDKIRMAP